MLASVPIAHLQCHSQIRFTCICSFFSQIHDFPLRTATPSVCHHWCPVMSPRDPGISLDPSFYFSSYIPLFISFFFFSSLCSFLKKKKKKSSAHQGFCTVLVAGYSVENESESWIYTQAQRTPTIYSFKLWYLCRGKELALGERRMGWVWGQPTRYQGPGRPLWGSNIRPQI